MSAREPTPEITVGCIAWSGYACLNVEVIATRDDQAWSRAADGCNYVQPLAALTYVAASWDEVPA